jgi:hypothetical protein
VSPPAFAEQEATSATTSPIDHNRVSIPAAIAGEVMPLWLYCKSAVAPAVNNSDPAEVDFVVSGAAR